MRKNILILLGIAGLVFFSFPSAVLAAGIPSPSTWLEDLPKLTNLPGTGMDTIRYALIPLLVSLGLYFLIILSLIFLLLGGIRWITSGGDKEGLAKAKATVTYAVVGLVLGLGSFAIISVVSYVFQIDLGVGIQPTTQGCYQQRSACYESSGCNSLSGSAAISCMNNCDRICTP